MLPLSEMQQCLRDAIVRGDANRVADLLIGGSDPNRRLAIHRHHYQSSLETVLRTKFQATEWLVGTPFLQDAIRDFVREHPPTAPCMAEYGDTFPQFIALLPGAERVPYLRAFAELEWWVGQAAISVDQRAVGLDSVSGLKPEHLHDAILCLQPGLHYLAASRPVDELLKLYLSETKPDDYPLRQAQIWLEIHGSRGAFELERLEAAEFAFRRAVQQGRTIGEAAADALDSDSAFDAGLALRQLIDEGRVTAIAPGNPGSRA